MSNDHRSATTTAATTTARPRLTGAALVRARKAGHHNEAAAECRREANKANREGRYGDEAALRDAALVHDQLARGYGG